MAIVFEAVVVAPESLAADAGAAVLEMGGNVFDAAVATALVEGVVNPQLCGIGGFGAAVIQATGKPTEVVQFYSPAGSLAHSGVFADVVAARGLANRPDGRDRTRGDVSVKGYKAIAVPGTVQGLFSIWQRYGSRTWAELCAPAIELAVEGFPVTSYIHSFWSREATGEGGLSGLEILKATLESERIYTRDGTPLRPGDWLRQADLGKTLSRIAVGGSDEFYRGGIAEQAAADLEQQGSLVTLADFHSYSVRTPVPLMGTYRGYGLAANPPPGAGFQILQVLNLLETYDLNRLGHNSPAYVRLIVSALRRSFADRRQYLGDPDFVDVPSERLASKAYAEALRAEIGAGIERGGPTWDTGTTHLCIMDNAGNAVTMTHSLGSSAGVVTPGLGFLYNNCMAGYSLDPNHPNSIASGKRRVAGSVPTLLYRDGVPVCAVGSPGGPPGLSGTVQVILNIVDFGMSPSEAVLAPRFHFGPDTVQVEPGIPMATVRGLGDFGSKVQRIPECFGQRFGRVQVTVAGAQGLSGASDPRSEGGYRRVTRR